MAEPNAEWLDVLSTIEESLRQTLERTAEPPAAPVKPGGTVNLARLDERLRYWQTYLDRGEANAARAQELLAAEEAAIVECRDGLARLRERLENWVKRSS
jgi:hypothetical protein